MKTHPQIKKGQFIGQIDLFTGMNQNNFIKSQSYTHILRITHSDMIKTVREENKDFEKFCQIKDKILMYEDYSQAGIKCQVCDQTTHLIQECPFVHIQRHSIYQKNGWIKSEDQQRKDFIRKQMKKFFLVFDSNDQLLNKIFNELQIEDYILKVNQIKRQLLNNEQSLSDYEDSEHQSFLKQNEELQTIQEEALSQQSSNRSLSHLPSCSNSCKTIKTRGNNRCSINQQIEEVEDNQSEKKGNLAESEKNIYQKEKSKQFISSSCKKTDQMCEAQKSELNQRMFSSDPSKVINSQKLFPVKQQVVNTQIFLDPSEIDSDDFIKKMVKKQETLKFMNKRQSNLRASQIIRIQQLSYQSGLDDKDYFNPWNFEKLQDYKYYFKNGNSGFKIQKYSKYQSKLIKKQKKSFNKSQNNLII